MIFVSDKGADGGQASLDTISEGAGLFLTGKLFSKGIGFVTNFVLTRGLGASLYGIFSYINILFALVMVFTRLGGNKSVLRYLPEYEDDSDTQNSILLLTYATSLVASVVVAGLIFLSAPIISAYTLDKPIFTEVLRVAALVIPFRTLSRLTFATFKSVDRMQFNVITSSGVRPIIRLIFVGIPIVLGYSLYGAVVGLIAAGIVTFLVSIGVLLKYTKLGGLSLPDKKQTKEYYDFSIPLTFNQLGNFLYNRVDILIVGFLLTDAAVGIYNISVVLAGLLVLPLTAFNQMFPPIASKLYHDDEADELESVYGTITRWIFTLSLFPALVVFAFPQEILSIFGPDFVRGRYVLILFAVAQLTNCAVGPSGFLLMMTDHQYLTLFNQLSSGILNTALNIVLILEFGFIGAAVATASVLAGINILRVGQVWYLEGLQPYDLTYVKPLMAGGLSIFTMFAVGTVLSGYVLLVLGAALGFALFAVVMYLLGFEESEKEMIRKLIDTV